VTFDVAGLAQRIADREAVEAETRARAARDAEAASLAAFSPEHVAAAAILGARPRDLDTVVVTVEGDVLVEFPVDLAGNRPLAARIVDPANPDGAGAWGVLRVWPESKPRPRRWTTTASQGTPLPDAPGIYFTPRPTSTEAGA
jgi:hypothetical protein